MIKIISVNLVGSAYKGGTRMSGFATVFLNNGQTIHVPEEKSSFEGAIQFAEKNGCMVNGKWESVNASEYRQRLLEWVKTGFMPLAKP